MPAALKFLTPEALAAAIIGKGGAVIAEMRQSTQAKLGVSDHNDYFPGTDCRILTVQANTAEATRDVSNQVIAKVDSCVQNAPSESLGQPGELKLKTLVPKAAVGGIIGKGGSNIKQLREQSGAKISINEPLGSGPGAEQVVSITGSIQALEYVMAEVNKQVQALGDEPWFSSWTSAPSMGGKGTGGGFGMGPPMGKGGGYSGGYGGMGGMGGPGVDLMMQVAQGMPPYVMEDSRGFALSCVVPNRLVGGLIGRGGAGTKEVQNITGTKIGIREIPGDTENRSLNIAGPLSNTCAAYMMMMKRYLDSEAAASMQGGGGA